MARVYVAASLAKLDVAQKIARLIVKLGHLPVSTWHETVGAGAKDPYEADERRAIATTCVAQVKHADFLIAYTAGGYPCGTFTEIGLALGDLKPVIWCLPPDQNTRDGIRRTNVFDSLELVTKVTSSELLEAAIVKVAGAFA